MRTLFSMFLLAMFALAMSGCDEIAGHIAKIELGAEWYSVQANNLSYHDGVFYFSVGSEHLQARCHGTVVHYPVAGDTFLLGNCAPLEAEIPSGPATLSHRTRAYTTDDDKSWFYECQSACTYPATVSVTLE